MSDLRFAMIGTGFWARYQLAGWQELSGARCVALYNRTRSKAEALAQEFGVPAVYDDAEALLARERLDFVDIVTDVHNHRRFVELAAGRRLPIICQKPMAPSLAEAEAMTAACRNAGVPLFIHENWRWQEPIRQFKRVLDEGRIGRVFRGRIQYSNSFPVFDNQPFLKELEEFILADMGTHILDTARFLFGEGRRLFCRTSRVHGDIKGEDVATVMMEMGDRATVVCEISYASRMEHDRFPETFIVAEGDRGSAELGPDFWIRVTTDSGTLARRCPPPRYRWADPAYANVHASIVSCNAQMLRALQAGEKAETHAEDNLKTLRLVFGSYESARTGQAVVVGS